MQNLRSIRSMYWNNVDPSLPKLQAGVLNSLGLNVRQDIATGVAHGDWLQSTTEQLSDDESVLFLDIDAFPLSADVVERAFSMAERGGIFGAAQVANHLDPAFIYAGPMFLCFSKRTWNELGRPSLKPDGQHDAAGRLTRAANDRHIDVNLLFPSFVAKPRWSMLGGYCFGTATVYEGSVFHLFQSRVLPNSRAIFSMAANSVIRGEPIDFIQIHKKQNSIRNQIADYAGTKLKPRMRKLGLMRR